MSDKPVLERLQVKNSRRLAVLGAPSEVDALIGGLAARAEAEEADVVVLFAADRGRLDGQLQPLLARLRSDAILWIAYPKLSSRLAGDLNRNVIWAAMPSVGLTTVSQISVDDDWSALRLKRVP